MQEKHLFEYAVIRVVPRVEREEFLNVGVVLFCAKQKFLKCMYSISASRIQALCNEIDLQELEANLQAFDRICQGGREAGPIGELSPPERFRWLTAARSTVVQASKVHPGLCAAPEQKLQQLFQQLVL
ncbi:DUF3037 domain-containing protein [Pedobacter sp. SYSU D00535]|uniref:DUF3037 domain-containing protein n=1 Tax=Pedobacter sp. SYSU D00535 TaxID=2810308 RepID=UPI001A973B55|nr:DUF3037 domain-containing protein [Pedobacter sp. SYSU D00535]